MRTDEMLAVEELRDALGAENERLLAALDLARTELQTMGEFLSSEGYFVRARDVQETLHKIAVITEQLTDAPKS